MTVAGRTLDLDLVTRCEESRWDALRTGDLPALEQMFSDELTYVHSNGTEDSKGGYLGALESGGLSYRSIDAETTAVRLHGPVAVVTGTADMVVATASGEFPVSIAFTAAWRIGSSAPHGEGVPQMIAWHSSPRST